MQQRRKSRQTNHGLRAAIGISIGLVLAVAGAIGGYSWLINHPNHLNLGMLPLLLGLPLSVWGCAHLAKHKGYPTAIAYTLCVIGIFIAGMIGASRSPRTVCVSFIFSVILPAIVLLSLPTKFRDSRRQHWR